MRSLGVIFLADVVGYSKMMAQDEPGTLGNLENLQKMSLDQHSKNIKER